MAHGGIATLIDLSIARTPGRIRRGVGTQEYMSPEQAAGGVVGPASDVWGLGATLFEAATGARPFGPLGASEARAFVRGDLLQLTRDAPSIASLRPRLPPRFVGLVSASLAHDPGRRPSVRELHDGLAEWVEP